MIKLKSIEVNGTRVVVCSDGSFIRAGGRGGKNKAGRTFGYKNPIGYGRISVGGKVFMAHRLVAMAFVDDFDDTKLIDHINGNKFDNRLENLRILSSGDNVRAFRPVRGGTTSRFRGVSKRRGASHCEVKVAYDGKRHYAGSFKSEEAAAIAYDRKATELGYMPEALNSFLHPELLTLQGA